MRPRRVHNNECPGSAAGELVCCSGSRNSRLSRGGAIGAVDVMCGHATDFDRLTSGRAIHLRWGMRLGPFGLNRLPNPHLELFLGQCPVAGD